MSRPFREMRPAERRSALVLLGALALAVLAALEPLGGAGVPPSEPGLLRPMPDTGGAAGAYAAASPFDPARRPVDGADRLPGLAQTAAPPPAALRLVGILVEGERRRAMFADSGIWQEAGSPVGDWILEAVEPRAVRLSRGGEVMVLRSDDALR